MHLTISLCVRLWCESTGKFLRFCNDNVVEIMEPRLNEWSPLLLHFVLKGWRSIRTWLEVIPKCHEWLFSWWWLRLPKALEHSSVFGCFGFHFQVGHLVPGARTISTKQLLSLTPLARALGLKARTGTSCEPPFSPAWVKQCLQGSL